MITMLDAKITDHKISEDIDRLIERRKAMNNNANYFEVNMKENRITISESGVVSVPDNVQMRDFEIAELFGAMIPTVRAHVGVILKTGIATGDYTNGATLVGNNLLPDYFGRDMVVAIAFRVQSYKAEIFRKWIIRKTTTAEHQLVVLQYNCNTIHLSEQN